ncbi:MAG: cytochrome c biogenesis heme-transporting ATPase CcmA [Gammaproteobacteria bacterium]|nr:MAG: cytochrome c biogenesis heme-transporting ATPase CcmA [Gammaproteobacteria bacterium]
MQGGSVQPRLAAHGLEVSRADRVLFSGLSFDVEPGSVLLVEGRNGSGKTTLLRTIAGLRYPDAGEVTWCGEPVTEGALAGELVWIGHLPGIKDDLTVLENLAMARALGSPTGMTPEEAVEVVGLVECEDRQAKHLSAGQRRRVALARLLLVQARLWILDEPYTSLDREAVRFVEGLITEHVAAGGLVVMTAHQDVRLPGVPLARIDLSS